jgi:branched-chain amino acid transport system ATP-binding protein
MTVNSMQEAAPLTNVSLTTAAAGVQGEGLVVSGLTTGYGRQPAVISADLAVRPGEFVAVVGPNGAGKSTLVRAVAGLIPAWKGSIRLGETALDRLSARSRVQRGIVAVLQGAPCFPSLTVGQNIDIAVRLVPATREFVDEILGSFPRLLERWDAQARTLSGGERQMLALARAIFLRPKVLLLDEPSFGLAIGARQRLVELLDDLRRKQGWSVLIVEQDVQLIRDAQTTYFMASGNLERVAGNG